MAERQGWIREIDWKLSPAGIVDVEGRTGSARAQSPRGTSRHLPDSVSSRESVVIPAVITTPMLSVKLMKAIVRKAGTSYVGSTKSIRVIGAIMQLPMTMSTAPPSVGSPDRHRSDGPAISCRLSARPDWERKYTREGGRTANPVQTTAIFGVRKGF